MKTLALAVVAAGVAFGAVTWWALESGGIAVLETRRPRGGVRSTHVWYVEPDGELWLEAGSPENGWFRDVQHDPAVTLAIDGRSARYRARPASDPAAHRRVRALIREKYGLRDRWIQLIVDASRSVGVRLLPVEERPSRDVRG